MFFSWRRVLRSKTLWASGLVIGALGLAAALAPWLAPHDPYRFHIPQASLPPAWEQNAPKPGQAEFPLGTDRFGRDVLSRWLYGARTAFGLALLAVPLAALIGAAIGLSVGYGGGRLDAAFLLAADMVQSLPGLMFMVIVILIARSALAPSWFNGLLTLCLGFVAVGWVDVARQVRLAVLALKQQLFIEAARALGASPGRILLRHILPNVWPVVMVWMINHAPAVILLEAALGYIGVGVIAAVEGDEFTVVSWGGLFFAGRSALNRNPLILMAPALGLLLISMGFVWLGDFFSGVGRPEGGAKQSSSSK